MGATLLDAFTGSTEAAGIWTIQTGIFPENTASLRHSTSEPDSAASAPASASAAITAAGATSPSSNAAAPLPLLDELLARLRARDPESADQMTRCETPQRHPAPEDRDKMISQIRRASHPGDQGRTGSEKLLTWTDS
jgi:hypothetical protein